MRIYEFNPFYTPVPRRGLTSPEAVEYLRKEFPHIPRWTILTPRYRFSSALNKMVGQGYQQAGKIGDWAWSRVPCPYPELIYWEGVTSIREESDCWAGMLNIRSPGGQEFMLFSYLDSGGEVGKNFATSTVDFELLDQFLQAAYLHFKPQDKDRITIDVFGGESVTIERGADEYLVLPPELRQDIERQAFSFFEDAEAYKALRLTHRRGFLFTGEPGNGKSMMLRHLIRECHRKYEPSFAMLRINNDTNNDDLDRLWNYAERNAPTMVILEDLDSLSKESKVTRSSFLAQLDGVAGKEGLLIIGTTNHPEEVDPALIHRPSRFDRVWRFPLPDHSLRYQYLAAVFDKFPTETVDRLATQTNGWSFAYLRELRVSAAIACLSRHQPDLTEEAVLSAHALLSAQFYAGRKHYVEPAYRDMGFVRN